jgi:hypothetical protein
VPKKLAVGARKAAMKGRPSATKRELIDAGKMTARARTVAGPGSKRAKPPKSS